MPRLGKIEKTVYINQDDPRFDGTHYREDNFTLLMHKGFYASLANEEGRNNAKAEWKGAGDAPVALIGKHIVCALIDDWQGFTDEQGDEMSPTTENKSKMFDYDTDLFDLIYRAYVDKIRPKTEDITDDAMGKQPDFSSGTTLQEAESLEVTPATPAEEL